jgi:repressor LexA
MPEELTKRQQQLFDFIQEYYNRNGYPPTIREIARKMKIKSTKGVVDHLTALQKKGFIKRSEYQSRGITISDGSPGAETPIMGRIAAGQPILAIENREGALKLGFSFSSLGTSFLLRVKGTSMIGAGIYDGDLVLVRQQPTAENGDIVVAMVNEEATVKYFKQTKTGIILEPANAEFKPIEVNDKDEFSIVGKVIIGLRIIDGTVFNALLQKN